MPTDIISMVTDFFPQLTDYKVSTFVFPCYVSYVRNMVMAKGLVSLHGLVYYNDRIA